MLTAKSRHYKCLTALGWPLTLSLLTELSRSSHISENICRNMTECMIAVAL